MFNPIVLRKAATEWLSEDISATDVGGAVVGFSHKTAVIYMKSPGVVAGFPFIAAVCNVLGCSVEWYVKEGDFVNANFSDRIPVGAISGPSARLLQIERTVQEVLSRASACASYARRCSEGAKKSAEWTGIVAATRKTTPGSFRMVEKYGAIVGGAHPHRYNMSSMVYLNDNHIDIAGSVIAAVEKARSLSGFSTKIEVECRTVQDALDACKAGADIVMLDNFRPNSASAAAQQIKKRYPHAIVEVAGGITAETIQEFAKKGVDVISVGRITHGPPMVDFSMKTEKPMVAGRSKL